jgi:hypothetical protein
MENLQEYFGSVKSLYNIPTNGNKPVLVKARIDREILSGRLPAGSLRQMDSYIQYIPYGFTL